MAARPDSSSSDTRILNITSRRFRLRAVWLLIIPFYVFATPTTRLMLAGGAVAALGALLRGWAAGHLGKEQVLTVTGPYAHSRNPLYVGSLLMGVGMTIAGDQLIFLGLFLVFFFFVYRGTAFKEEGVLEGVFGEPYRHYAAAVPLFVPRLTAYRSPQAAAEAGDDRVDTPRGRSFSWSLYLANKEWEAGVGLVVAFGLLALKKIVFPAV